MTFLGKTLLTKVLVFWQFGYVLEFESSKFNTLWVITENVNWVFQVEAQAPKTHFLHKKYKNFRSILNKIAHEVEHNKGNIISENQIDRKRVTTPNRYWKIDVKVEKSQVAWVVSM